MKNLKLSALILSPLLSLSVCAVPENSATPALSSGQSHDATQEINQLAQTVNNIAAQCQNNGQGQCNSSQGSHCQVQHDSDDELDQVALSNFASMVQSFFNIVQNPHNGHVVGSSIMLMITSIITVAKKFVGKMSHHRSNNSDLKEREAFLAELETELLLEADILANKRKQIGFE